MERPRDTGLEEPMWRLRLGGNTGYPLRPGEPDCTYYLRTGLCSFGERCRYNHPRDRSGALLPGTGRSGMVEYPERPGQPECTYYMKNGTCKFGSTCKFHHPKQGGHVQQVLLNYFGYPLRPGEKECSYYMKTGQCKFGLTCKFHHPEPSSVPSSQQYPPLATMQLGTSVMPRPYVSGSYGPMMVSPGVLPMPYPAPVSPVLSRGGQQTVQAGPAYNIAHQAAPLEPGSSLAGFSGSGQGDHKFPERPGQPECQYYMRTGDCKFGATCKYHHPPNRSIAKTDCHLSPLVLTIPLLQDAQPCTYYMRHGECKFGPACRFDHPMGSMSYSPSASSLSDMPVAPYPIGYAVATLAPSSSSSDLRLEYFTTKDSASSRMASVESASGSIGSIFSRGGYALTPSFTHKPLWSL
uniref:C3H1-type domain-containing protein n=1 Tax=Ananas comosus var. bracteatus TaxID=296719 RepID=A0A6V7PRB2_ANACO|nr:unnamed protein product [Ananas comosus var. bracteatus]